MTEGCWDFFVHSISAWRTLIVLPILLQPGQGQAVPFRARDAGGCSGIVEVTYTVATVPPLLHVPINGFARADVPTSLTIPAAIGVIYDLHGIVLCNGGHFGGVGHLAGDVLHPAIDVFHDARALPCTVLLHRTLAIRRRMSSFGLASCGTCSGTGCRSATGQ